MGVSGLTGTVILFLNSQTIEQDTFYIFHVTNLIIHDILMEQIQSSYPEEVSVTFTCEIIFSPSQTSNHFKYKIHNSCKFGMLYGVCLDQQRQYQSSVFQNICYMCKSAWLINYLYYYDSHLHLPFQLQLLQDVS